MISIITTSRATDLLKEGFGAGNAIIRLIRFVVAGLAGFFLSFLSISHLMIGIPIEQLIFVIVSIPIFLIIKNKIFPTIAH